MADFLGHEDNFYTINYIVIYDTKVHIILYAFNKTEGLTLHSYTGWGKSWFTICSYVK